MPNIFATTKQQSEVFSQNLPVSKTSAEAQKLSNNYIMHKKFHFLTQTNRLVLIFVGTLLQEAILY